MPMLTIPPTVAHRPKGLIDCAEITDTLICPGQDRDAVYGQTRELLKAGYLVPVAREERGKKAFLMKPDHMLIADVLLRMREYGLRGSADLKADPMAAASLGLRHWSGGKPEGAKGSPAAHVIAEYEAGATGWMFEVLSFFQAELGCIAFEGRIYRIDRLRPENDQYVLPRHGQGGGWHHRATFAVDLTDSLNRWHPSAKDRREAMN
jgi:hypothetical protein